MVPVPILTVRNSVSTETVRKHYGITTETLRNSVSTPYCVVHGYPRKARESDFCMHGGRRDKQGCVMVMQGCVTVMQGVSSYTVIETSGVRITKILMTQQLLSRNTKLFLSRHYKTRPRSGDPSLSREYLINGISHYYDMQHRVALRLNYGLTIPWPRHGRPWKFWTFQNIRGHCRTTTCGSPGIMKDHDGLFLGLTTFHHGRPKLADPWWSVMKIVTVWLGLYYWLVLRYKIIEQVQARSQESIG